MKGYWGKPEATAEAIPDGWFRTGDLAQVDADGYFHIVGRAKDLIIRGGYNVYPREIEEVLHEHQAVAEVAVIGIQHAELGEEVGAAVKLKPGRQPPQRNCARSPGNEWRPTSTRAISGSSANCLRAPPARSSTAKFSRHKTSSHDRECPRRGQVCSSGRTAHREEKATEWATDADQATRDAPGVTDAVP
jgi:acyl-CoA synthetase (AMP-forming)/AMP-acid ligase II